METLLSPLAATRKAIELVKAEISEKYESAEKAALFEHTVTTALKNITCGASITADRACIYSHTADAKDPEIGQFNFLLINGNHAEAFEFHDRHGRKLPELIAYFMAADPKADLFTLRAGLNTIFYKRNNLHASSLYGSGEFISSDLRERLHPPAINSNDHQRTIVDWENTLYRALREDGQKLVDEAMHLIDPVNGHLLVKTGIPDAYNWIAEGNRPARVKALETWQAATGALMNRETGRWSERLVFPDSLSVRIDQGEDPLELGVTTLGVSPDFIITGLSTAFQSYPFGDGKFYKLCGPLLEITPQSYWPGDFGVDQYWQQVLEDLRTRLGLDPANNASNAQWASCVHRIDPEHFSPGKVQACESYHDVTISIDRRIAKKQFLWDVG